MASLLSARFDDLDAADGDLAGSRRRAGLAALTTLLSDRLAAPERVPGAAAPSACLFARLVPLMARLDTCLRRSALARALRDKADRWLHAQLDATVSERVRCELASQRKARLTEPSLWGPADRLTIADSAVVNDALFNTVSGRITVEDDAFFGHGVALLTGTHDIVCTRQARQLAVPDTGRDILVDRGAWIASRAVVLGPCHVGADAVVAAGSVVTTDVPSRAVVAGNPARIISRQDGAAPDSPPVTTSPT